MSDELDDRCHYCGKRIKYTSTSKRRRTYCDDACKQAAHRWRKKLGTDADALNRARAQRIRRWAAKEYPDELIVELLVLWHELGEEAFTTIEPILIMHEAWAYRMYAQTLLDSKRNEV